MLRQFKSFSNPFLAFNLLTKITPKPNSQIFSYQFFSGLSHFSTSQNAHYSFDEMPGRTPFIFHTLNLLKQNYQIDPNLIAYTHSLALKTNLLSDISICTSLITAYSRAHDLDSSLALFDEVVVDQDLISWNAIISACVLNSEFDVSIDLFREMVYGFGEFDSTTIVIVLSGFSRARNLKYGLVLHGLILKIGFSAVVYLCNALVDMYAKCGELRMSELVFEEMEAKDATSWNSIINGCLHNDFPMRSAFYCKEMCCSNVRPDQVSLSCVISACSCVDDLYDFGESIHACVIKLGFKGIAYSSIDNSLISFYSSCGIVEAAEKIFEGISSRNAISWNSMIKCLIENGRTDASLNLFRSMLSKSEAQPDSITLVTIIPVCCEFNLLLEGKSIHEFAIRKDLGSNLSVTNCLLDMYLKCGDLISADLVFRNMHSKDLVTWNTIISGYATSDFYREESRVLFRELLEENHRCSLATLLAVLPSCNCPQDLTFGKSIHCWKLKYGFENVISVTNALMLMYINCGDLIASSKLLETNLLASDIVSWNTIIAGFMKNERYDDALGAFKFMHNYLNIESDAITLVSALSATGYLNLLSYGQSLHGFLQKSPVVSDIRVKNALITMYFRCGDTKSSESVFISEGDRNLCSWASMICGFAQNRDGEKAISYFRSMEISNFQPNEISIVGLLCACTIRKNLTLGKEVHPKIFHFGFYDNVYISSALVDMYSKCGRIDISAKIFESSREKTNASWNSMISAYGFHGDGQKSIELFSEMCNSGVSITKSTFISLLSACSHNGLIDEGLKYYKLMIENFGIEENVEHRVLMVDMLGKAGRIREAYEFVERLKNKAESEVWGALLSACNDHGDLETGKFISEKLFSLETKNVGYYVTLSNLYAYHGMWSSAEDIRGRIRDRRLKKPLGTSSIDVCSR